ncbi:hypothetical protein [Allofournierella sp.]|uniref:hypothetical protein n=1 Tax=Allofournierella sp. TaxID=1940256 RepID=UPI003AB8FE1B
MQPIGKTIRALRLPLRLPRAWRSACLCVPGAVLFVWAYTALPAALPWLPGGVFPLAYPLTVHLYLYHAASPLFALAGAALYLGVAPKPR